MWLRWMRRTCAHAMASVVVVGLSGAVTPWHVGAAQDSAPADAQRVDARVRALQAEAERLAGEARTLLTDLRRLEIARDLRMADVRAAQAAVAESQRAVGALEARISALEQQRTSQLPQIKAQLVALYKQGRGGYARRLLRANSFRDLGRTSRAIAATAALDQRRLAEHRRTLDTLRSERATLETQVAALRVREADAVRARDAAVRAANEHAALIADIDRRRDLNAELTGELQAAYEKLQQEVVALSASGRVSVAVPLQPLRGALEWPLEGRIGARYGQVADRPGAPPGRNGIEILAEEGTSVAAVHTGTVAFANAFSGFGLLVIVDHGGNCYSLYGHLSSVSVKQGDPVESGAELGRSGSAPAGPPSLYFELRVDGRSVDPIQWLKPR